MVKTRAISSLVLEKRKLSSTWITSHGCATTDSTVSTDSTDSTDLHHEKEERVQRANVVEHVGVAHDHAESHDKEVETPEHLHGARHAEGGWVDR